MDIFAHGLWVGAGLRANQRSEAVAKSTVILTIALAMVPDLGHMLPVALWSLFSGAPGALLDYLLASPGQEPAMPTSVAWWSHHLHCILHSGIVSAAVTTLLWAKLRRFWLPLAGWWSHIVIDIFTHSQDYYPVPVFYPVSDWGYDGLAWNTPGFMLANYLALGVVWTLLISRNKRAHRV